jgi:AcrR family transcriptional regulator
MTPTADAPTGTTESPRRPRARRGEGALLRDEILDATEQLLFTGGQSAVTIRAVGRAVGVSAPAIYRHFTDRDALVLAVSARRFELFDSELERAAADGSDPAEELQRRGAAYVRFGLASPEAYRLLFMHEDDGALSQMSDNWPSEASEPGAAAFAHLLDNVQRAQAAGLVVDDDPYLVACGLFVTMHGLTAALIGMSEFPWPSVEQLVDHVLTTLLRGLRPAG